jgi:uncharacterized membrane protein (UPF0127 family)
MIQRGVYFGHIGAAPIASLLAELAATPAQMQQGLSGRASLPDGFGMLFDMGAQGHHVFHMLGVAFPLDFIFVGEDGRVSSIVHDVPSYAPELIGADSRWVIEAPAGWAARHGIQPGMFAGPL